MTSHHRKRRYKANHKQGTVLLEVLIVSLILGLVLIPMARLFLVGAGLVEDVKNHDIAMFLAQGIIENLKATPYREIKSLDGEQSLRNHPDFKYTLKVVEEQTCFKVIQVGIIYRGAGKERNIVLTATIADY